METYTKEEKEKKVETHTKLDVIPKSPATPTSPMPGSRSSPKRNKGKSPYTVVLPVIKEMVWKWLPISMCFYLP